MDVERTIEFILRQRAKAEARQPQATHPRKWPQLNSAELRELTAVQKVTETKLQGLIDAMRRERNGSHRKN
jgi:hypothetical protein